MPRSSSPQASPTRPLDADGPCLHGLRPHKLQATGQHRIGSQRMNDEYIKIPRTVHHSCKLPENPDAVVWRYQDLSKFKWLIEKRALYLRRIDLLEDKFEGTYSRQQILDQDDWLRSKGEAGIVHTERQNRIQERQSAFVSCWCWSDIDLDLMWKGYVRCPPGVAVKSTVRRLQRTCDAADDMWPIDISLVKYIDHASGQHINYPGIPEVCFTKDAHFRLDKELRIVCWQSIQPPSQFRSVSVHLEDLIVSVVVSPMSSRTAVAEVSALLRDNGLSEIRVEYSRQERPVEK